MTDFSTPPLPGGFLAQIERLLPKEEFSAFLNSYLSPHTRAARRRPADKGAEPGDIPWEPLAFSIPHESEMGAHPLHEAGQYYLQEPSAMVPARVLSPRPGDTVLDLCAAPGGKATQLAAMMRGKGTLVCNEPHPKRAKVLSANVERMGITNACVTSCLPEKVSEIWQNHFDKILVDAPCSGEGMFRKNPDARAEWTPDAPARCAERQRHILHHAAKMLAPGGRMVYSTCTFNDVENEGVILDFLAEHPEFSLVPFSLPGLPSADEGMLRLWPHKTRGEGHFAALLKKDGAAKAASSCPLAPLPPMAAEAMAALRDIAASAPAPNALFKGVYTAAPANPPPLSGVPVMRLGLHLGYFKGNLFMPDHALALALPFDRQFSVTEAEARLFQHGEVLPCPDALSGFAAPTLDGIQLGFGKAACGQLKNHYPKGLRK